MQFDLLSPSRELRSFDLTLTLKVNLDFVLHQTKSISFDAAGQMEDNYASMFALKSFLEELCCKERFWAIHLTLRSPVDMRT